MFVRLVRGFCFGSGFSGFRLDFCFSEFENMDRGVGLWLYVFLVCRGVFYFIFFGRLFDFCWVMSFFDEEYRILFLEE